VDRDEAVGGNARGGGAVSERGSGAEASSTGKRVKLPRNVKALAAVSLLTDASSEMIYPLLPLFLTTVLGASAATVGTIEGLAESTASVLKLASGWWSDRVRRKPLVLFGYGLASLVRPLVALATSSGQVLAIRLADRVGKGVRTAPRDALLADSTPASVRGRAFGFHRAGDHAGAVIGPLVAWVMLQRWQLPLQSVFLWAAVPAVLSVIVVMVFVKETKMADGRGQMADGLPRILPDDIPIHVDERLGSSFWKYLVVLLVFTLGNSTDAFLLLRATQVGVPVAMVPILWAVFHAVKAAASTPSGALSDRVGRRPLIVAGWSLYAVAYLLFGRATSPWEIWALFLLYGLHFGFTEGVEKALVADLVPASKRGTAFGWYNFTIGLGALPASVMFGLVWDRVSPQAAFSLGAVLAFGAAVGMLVLVRPTGAKS
jgi:MFS family permease